MSDIPKARPASTVVLLRDSVRGLETLMLKRNKALMFAGGLWVFPGGALDAQDFDGCGDNAEAAARVAAAREAEEESGLRPDLDDMVLLSHWTTPVEEPKRFATWIYAAPVAADDEVVIDGGEIHDSTWLPVREVVQAHERGEMGMLPPTYITLCTLSRYSSVKEAVAAERETPVPQVFPIFGADGENMAVLFRGDAEHPEGGDARARHRAVLADGRWRYIHLDVAASFPPLIRE